MVLTQLPPAGIAYVLAIVVATAITTAFAVLSWRRREVRGATSLAGLMAGASVWNACIAIQLVTTVEAVIVGLQPVKLGAAGVVVAGFVALALEFTGNDALLDRRTVALLALEPAAIVVLTATNAWHGLVWHAIEPATATYGTVEANSGIGFWVHTVYSYVLLAVAFGLVGLEILKSRSIYRRQAGAVVVGALFPIGANVLRIADVFAIDLQPLAFALTGLVLGWNIRRYRLMDLIPIAREQVVDTVPDPVIVLDERDRITDVNEAGVDLLDAGEDGLIGTEFAAAFAEYPVVVDEFDDAVQSQQVVRLPVHGGVRFYEIRGAPIDGPDGTRYGRILVFHDVTEREESRRELERQNEQLEQFASVVSHDLRNPLSVAEGYLPMARETGEDEHFDAIEESLDRMDAIIEDVLTLAREGSRIEGRTPVSLEDLAETAWEQVDTGDAELVVADDVTIGADANRLQRLLENLFRNALEHGADGDHDEPLTVTVGPIGQESPGSLRPAEEFGFFVEDDGVGIPDADREAIFEPGQSTSSEGTGLGLSIVQGIAEAHGWSVRATASAAGGARFEVTGAPPISHPASVEPSPGGAQR